MNSTMAPGMKLVKVDVALLTVQGVNRLNRK
jgi:hypothetical protein